LNEERKKQGKSQSDAAKDANLTQQQFSRVENGDNCTIWTYLKACHAVGLKLEVKQVSRPKTKIRNNRSILLDFLPGENVNQLKKKLFKDFKPLRDQ
jgi:transcriptional regulator with XRE-family HTH domain